MMVFCLSEPLDAALSIARAHRAKTVIVINKLKHFAQGVPVARCPGKLYVNDGLSRGFSDGCPPAVTVVTAGGNERSGEIFALELGQPLHSLEDAQLFFETYRDDLNAGSPDFSALFARLKRRENAQWPYYFFMRRELCMFVVELEYGEVNHAPTHYRGNRSRGGIVHANGLHKTLARL
jgi:hypothetical protein